MSYFSSAIWYQNGVVVVIKEYPSSCSLCNQRSWWYTYNFHDCSHLIIFVLSSENRNTHQAFKNNTAKAPHINSHGKRYAQNNLRCPIKPRLDIRIDPLANKARTAIINDFDTTLILLFEQYVFRLQITMNDLVVLLVFQCLQDLDGESSDQVLGNALEIVVLDEFVQVDGKQFK